MGGRESGAKEALSSPRRRGAHTTHESTDEQHAPARPSRLIDFGLARAFDVYMGPIEGGSSKPRWGAGRPAASFNKQDRSDLGGHKIDGERVGVGIC